MSEEMGYRPILTFDDQSESFAMGFQAGEIWTLMKTREPFRATIRGENLELIQRMPSRMNYKFSIEPIGNCGWFVIEATPLEP
jgi:hypothetical protein